jgi:hypothetical protein
VYLFLSSRSLVLPIWLSQVPKAQLNWDSEPWEEIADEIIADLKAGHEQCFALWPSP